MSRLLTLVLALVVVASGVEACNKGGDDPNKKELLGESSTCSSVCLKGWDCLPEAARAAVKQADYISKCETGCDEAKKKGDDSFRRGREAVEARCAQKDSPARTGNAPPNPAAPDPHPSANSTEMEPQCAALCARIATCMPRDQQPNNRVTHMARCAAGCAKEKRANSAHFAASLKRLDEVCKKTSGQP